MAVPVQSIVMACVVLAAAICLEAEAAVPDCNAVTRYLIPCIPYLTNQGPLGRCCSGVNSLYAAAASTSDRQMVCRCLKLQANSYGPGVQSKAAGLPKQCGVNIPYKISLSTDCSKVK